eukprot:13002167-Ditylum_brightwellii.AAC.1
MVTHNTTPAKAIRASYSQGFNPGLQEDNKEWAELGKGRKSEEVDQDMMEMDSKKGEKQKLAADANDDGTKDTGIKATTSVKEAMHARGEKMIETKTIYESKPWMEFNIKEDVDRINIRSK